MKTGIFILAHSGTPGNALASKKWARLDRTRKVYACYTSAAPWTGQPLKTIEDFGHTIGAQEVFGATLLN